MDRERIERDLRSEDEEARRLAVLRTGLLAPVEAVPLLVERLGDASWRVRKAAIDRLAATPEPARAAASLILALADGENPGRRNAALEALIRCGSSAVPTLLDATRSPDVDVRKQVVDALCGIADPGALPRLVEMLDDEDPNVRGAAADALGAVGAPDAGEALLRSAAADEERLVRLSCLRALCRMEHPAPVEALESSLSDPLLRAASLSLLGYSDDPMAPEAILKGLGAASRATREAAMEALVRLVGRGSQDEAARWIERARDAVASDPEALSATLCGLAEADLAAALPRVQFLGLLALPATLPALLAAGRDEALAEVVLSALDSMPGLESALDELFEGLDSDARALACRALGGGREPTGERRLLACLADDDPCVRLAAAEALGSRGGDAAMEELVRRFERAAEDEHAEGEEARRLGDAIARLARSGHGADTRAAALVGERLHEGSVAFRRAAADVLAALGALDAVDLLLSDPDAGVRRAAVEALAGASGGTASEAVRLALADEAATVRIAAAAALAASRDGRALEDLEPLVADEDPRVRAAAMRAVGALVEGDRGERLARGIALLERGVADEGAVAMAAVEVLRDLADPSAVGVVSRLLEARAPELVCAAVSCLGAAAEAPRLEALVRLVAHEHWSVRAEAARVLGQRGVRRAAPALLQRLETEADDLVRDALREALGRLEAGEA